MMNIHVYVCLFASFSFALLEISRSHFHVKFCDSESLINDIENDEIQCSSATK